MEGYRKSSHAAYRCEYHLVWIPNYWHQAVVNHIKSSLKEILMVLCEWLDSDIMEDTIASDHVYLYVLVPPKHSPSHVMKILTGKSAKCLRIDFPKLSKKDLALHIWAPGYFVITVGIDRKVISKYVNEQQDS